MPVKAPYLLLTASGAVLVWSGLKGKSWSEVLRNLIAGKDPRLALDTNKINTNVADMTTGGGQTPSSSSYGPVTQPAGAGETAWITAFLASIGAPPTAANVSSISAWIQKETPWPPVASNNPLNTTYPMPGATNYNSVGVKNYPDALTGMRAATATINASAYKDIVAALRNGGGLCGKSFQGFSTWSGGGYSGVC